MALSNGITIMQVGLLHLVRTDTDLAPRTLATLIHVAGFPASSPPSVAAVAETLNIHKPAITRATDILIELGFLTRKKASEDKRKVELRVTPAGMTYLRDLGAAVSKAVSATVRAEAKLSVVSPVKKAA